MLAPRPLGADTGQNSGVSSHICRLHDRGWSNHSPRTAALRPDLFSTVTLLGVPYYGGAAPQMRPTAAMQRLGEASVGAVLTSGIFSRRGGRAVLEKDVRRSQRMFFIISRRL